MPAATDPIPVVVLGGTGYVSGELLRLLAGHPRFAVAAVASTSQPGEPVVRAFPHLAGTVLDALAFSRIDDLPQLPAPASRSACSRRPRTARRPRCSTRCSAASSAPVWTSAWSTCRPTSASTTPRGGRRSTAARTARRTAPRRSSARCPSTGTARHRASPPSPAASRPPSRSPPTRCSRWGSPSRRRRSSSPRSPAAPAAAARRRRSRTTPSAARRSTPTPRWPTATRRRCGACFRARPAGSSRRSPSCRTPVRSCAASTPRCGWRWRARCPRASWLSASQRSTATRRSSRSRPRRRG